MKRIIAALSGLVLLITCCCASVSFGASRNVRIGLERHYIGVGSIPVSDTTITVHPSGGSAFSASSGSGFNVQTAGGSYYDCGVKYGSYSEAKKYASSFSPNAVAVDKNGSWRVYCAGAAETATEAETEVTTAESANLSAEGSTEVTTELEKKSESSPFSGLETVSLSGNAIAFKSANETLFIVDGSDSVDITTGSGIVDLGGYSYRETIEIYRNGGTVNAVNVLPMEEYLLGVVTSEMPQSWPIEAIKAQAVAARTYTQRNLGKHGRYDLCDSTDCQQYNGVNGESAASKQAVNATKGVMAYYDGALISATYFSSSGGHTQSAEDVWGTAVPYLVGVDEINETGGKQWVRTFSYAEMTEMCKKCALNVGTVTAVKVGETFSSGLVKTMIIEGSTGAVTLERDEISQLFKNAPEGALSSHNFKVSTSSSKSNSVYVLASDNEGSVDINVISAVSADGTVGPLKNVNAVVIGSEDEYVISSEENNMTVAQDSVTITGSGYGHGVGMSQYGAKGMAELGYNYIEILKHYYTGIDVR